jgi:hypothetical protein
VEAVIIAKEGRVGVCIDICLEMSSGIQTPNDEAPRSPETKARSGRSSGEKGSASTSKEDTSDLLGLEGENGIGCLNLEDRGRRTVESEEPVNLMD